jgi:peroxiredoxin
LADYRNTLRGNSANVPDVVALSVDPPQQSKELKAQLGLPFRLLCDPEKKVVTAWGLLNSREKGGIAYNAAFGFDRDGRVVYRSLDSVASRASPEEA